MSREEDEAVEKKLLYYDPKTTSLIIYRQKLYKITNAIINKKVTTTEERQKKIEELEQLKTDIDNLQESYLLHLTNQKYQFKNNIIEAANIRELIKSEEFRRKSMQKEWDETSAEQKNLSILEKEVREMARLIDVFIEDSREVFTLSELKNMLKSGGELDATVDRYFDDFMENTRSLRKSRSVTREMEVSKNEREGEDMQVEEVEELFEFYKRMYSNTVRETDEMVNTSHSSVIDFEQSTSFHKERWTKNVKKLEAVEQCLKEFDRING